MTSFSFSLDLLQKSQTKAKFKVVESSNEVKAQPKTTTATAIAFTEDAKDFELGVDVLDAEAQLSEDEVITLLLKRQALTFAPLVGHFGIGMKFLQSLVARVGQPKGFRVKLRSAGFEELEVVRSAFAVGRTDDTLGRLVEHDLRF